MAKNVLPVDFQDDILSEDMDGRRKYQMITNADGTVSFVDVTEYTQVGSNFGQAQINATNEAVNESADKNKIIDTKADLMANTQAGMIAGASAVKAAVSELTENMKNYYFKDRGMLMSSADSITNNGAYRVSTDHPVNNVSNGILISFIALPDGSVAFQLLANYDGSSLYARSKWYGTWSKWKTITV